MRVVYKPLSLHPFIIEAQINYEGQDLMYFYIYIQGLALYPDPCCPNARCEGKARVPRWPEDALVTRGLRRECWMAGAGALLQVII